MLRLPGQLPLLGAVRLHLHQYSDAKFLLKKLRVLRVLPGRTGETFGKGTPGNNDTGAVDVSAATQKVGGAGCLLHPQS